MPLLPSSWTPPFSTMRAVRAGTQVRDQLGDGREPVNNPIVIVGVNSMGAGCIRRHEAAWPCPPTTLSLSLWRLSRAACSFPWYSNSGEQSNGQTDGSPCPLRRRHANAVLGVHPTHQSINPMAAWTQTERAVGYGVTMSSVVVWRFPENFGHKGGSDSGPTTKILSVSEDTMEPPHGKASRKHEMPADAPPMPAPCQSRDTPAALGVTEVVLGCLADGRAFQRQQFTAGVRYRRKW